MKELKQKLVQFKQITIELINALRKEEINRLDDLFDSRQNVIESMDKLTYTVEQFTNICRDLDLLNMQQELSELMYEKKESIKEELNKIQLTKNANNNYNKSFYADSGTFNKQI